MPVCVLRGCIEIVDFYESLLYSERMDVKENVKTFIEEQGLVEKGDRILLGLSGGADSVCLFYLLLELREEFGFALRAAHIHHGIRQAAGKDAAFVKALCEKEKVFCYMFEENVPAYAKREGLSEEEAGRILRYQDFEKSLRLWQEEEHAGSQNKQYKIATAHHENDQAETVLFQLFRGCGLAGLRGILPRRKNIIRPMLCLSRAEIERSLREKGIAWCEDETNRLEDYSRNRIRHQILSYAETEVCHGATAHIGKTAGIVREAEEYIRKQVKNAWKKMAVEKDGVIIFDITSLLREDVFLQKQLLLYGLEQTAAKRKDIGAVHMEDMLKLVKKQGNGELSLPGGVQVKKLYRNLFIFQESRGKEEGAFPGLWPDSRGFLYGGKRPEIKTEKIDLLNKEIWKEYFGIQDISEIMKCIPQKKYTKWFDYDKIENVFSIRHRESGDYLTIDGQMNRKSFRRYMIETKVPQPYRSRIWLLADGSHVMWVPGGRMSTYYKVTDQTKTILQIQICMEE